MDAPRRDPATAAPRSDAGTSARGWIGLLPYLLAGTLFGFIAVRSEIIAWYRIQEMFRFQSFHMYGVIGSAVLVGALAVWILKRTKARSWSGQPIHFPDKERTWTRYVLGGAAFGLGWGLVGACPGPIYALIGAGLPAFGVVLVGALLGTWTYGALQHRLPHG
ncbi:MAG: DUF6691 family protein [Trueperaceae bacterium]